MLLERCQQLAARARRAGARDFVCVGSAVHWHETTRTEQGRRTVAARRDMLTLTVWTDGMPVQLQLTAAEVERSEERIRAALRFHRATDALRRHGQRGVQVPFWQSESGAGEGPSDVPALPTPVADVDTLDAMADRIVRWDRIDRHRLVSRLVARSDVLLDQSGRVTVHRQAAQSLGLTLFAPGPQGLQSRTKEWAWDAAHRWDSRPSRQLLVDETERVANDLYDALLSAPPSTETRMVVLTASAAAPFLAAPGGHPPADCLAQRHGEPSLAALVATPPWCSDGTLAHRQTHEVDDITRVRCLRVPPLDHTARNLLGRVAAGYLVDGAAAWEWLSDGRVAVGFDAAWYVENGEVLHAVRDASMVMTAEEFWRAIRAVGDEATTERVVLRAASTGPVIVDAPAVLLDPASLQNIWVQTDTRGAG